jgi:subtilisin
VIDSGIDAAHPLLAGRVVSAWSVEAAGEGQPPQVKAAPPGANNDAYGHGTGVAGIIAQIAPNARLTDVRVLDSSNRGSGEALVEGFRWAVQQRLRLVNLSLACKARFAPQLHRLCEQAYQQNQIVIAAKRNMPLTDSGFPAEFSSSISVDLERFESPFVLEYRPDETIEYAAHGVEVLTAAPGGGYTRLTGTSFATPTVTGLVALLVGRFPDLRPFEVKSALKAWSR